MKRKVTKSILVILISLILSSIFILESAAEVPALAKLSGKDKERVQKLIFVGITRAMSWVYLSSTDPLVFIPLELISEAAETGSLTIQRFGEAMGGKTPPNTGEPVYISEKPDEDDDLLDIL